ncbi:MAG TPA: response regulator [Chthoniobacterales bacterium]|jgi:CheY-like chemotaxis protein|nr:response regulator [Chthoniobacterales bacterium]
MNTDSESHGHEGNAVKLQAAPEDHLPQELRAQLDAIIGFAKRLETKSGTDENVQQILSAARELLKAISRESAKPQDGDGAPRSAANERCDVLYIEDNSTNFASVTMLLRSKRALKVLQAISGKAGVALAQTHRPKLILLDLNLPDIHGSEVLQQLQKDAATARIPVVVMSGDATPSQIERLLVLGARNYLTKPFEVEPFLAVVDDVMQESTAASTT